MLVQAYPDSITKAHVAWAAYLWAVELWYAYAMEVSTVSSGQLLKRSASERDGDSAFCTSVLISVLCSQRNVVFTSRSKHSLANSNKALCQWLAC